MVSRPSEFKKGGLAGIALLLSVLVLAACGDAQNTNKVYNVGIYLDATSATFLNRMEGMKEGMKALNYVEGKTIIYNVLNTTGMTAEQEKAALNDLAAKNYDAYVVVSSQSAGKVKDLITKKPIVVAGFPDAVALGLIKSAEKPGGNMTGVENLNTELSPKRLEMLNRLDPSIKSVYMLYNPTMQIQLLNLEKMQATAKELGINLIIKQVTNKEESKKIVSQFKYSEAQAVITIGLTSISVSADELKTIIPQEKMILVGMERANLDLGAMFSYCNAPLGLDNLSG
jgi:putative ABC transport system substrate-binding protein